MLPVKDDRGFSLIELILSISILGFVLAAVFSIHDLGQKTYDHSLIQSNLQHDTVKVADFISRSVRAASEVQILSSSEDVPGNISEDDDDNYIYLYQAPGSNVNTVVLKNKNGMTSLVSHSVQHNNFVLEFKRNSDGKILEFTINTDYSSQKYNLNSQVKLENLDTNGFVGSLTSGQALRFKLSTSAAFSIFTATIDDTVGLTATGNREINSGNNNWKIQLLYNTLSDGLSADDIELTGMPAGLTYSVEKISDSVLSITVGGKALANISSQVTVQVKIKPSAVEGENVLESDSISLNLVPNPVSDFDNFISNDNVFVYGNQFEFEGNTVNGPQATIVVKGNLDSSLINGGALNKVTYIYIYGSANLNGGSAGLGSQTNPGDIYINGDLNLTSGGRDIYGDVYVGGNFYLKDARIHGNVYVKGSSNLVGGTIYGDLYSGENLSLKDADLKGNAYINGNVALDWTPNVEKQIYYTGTLASPKNYSTAILQKCIKQNQVPAVPGYVMPDYDIPSLKSDDWYAAKGYVSGNPSLSDGIKIYTDNYSFNDWRSYNNVVIVSKGDINLSGWITVTGVLYAPNGKVTFGGASFTGVVIAKDGFFVTSGGSTVTFKNISNYIANPSDYPF